MAKKRRQHGTGSLIKRGANWYLRYYVNGKRQEDPAGTTDEQEAQRKLKIRIGEVAAGQRIKENPTRATVRGAVNLVIEDYREQIAATTKDVESRAKLHIIPKIGSVQVSALTTKGLRAYVKSRKQEKASDAMINRELSIVRRGLKLATEQTPPWIATVPKIPMLREDNARTGFLDHEQYRRLLAALPTHVQMALVIGYHTGLRRGAVVRLRIDQVDLAAGVIRIESGQSKNRERHAVPLFGDLRAYVEMAVSGNKKFLCELSGKRLGSFRKTWNTACALVGVPGLLFHDLRRSAVRNMIQAGVPESVAMKISGHKTQSMLQRYNIIAERDVVKAGQRVEEHLNGSVVKESLTTGEKGVLQ